METVLKSLKDTEKLARNVAGIILERSCPVVALYGGLGSGKTTFIQFLARAFGVREKVLSPTFVIMRTFSLPKKVSGFKFLTHIDAYRIASAKELVNLGVKDILKDKENIAVIEWPEKIERYLPGNAMKIYFRIKGPKERAVTIEE